MPPGRPKSEDGGAKATDLVRIPRDLAKMIAWIVRIRATNSAGYLDQVLRARVAADYSAILPSVLQIKAAEDAAREREQLPPTEPLPVVIPLSKSTTFEDIQAEVARIDAANAANRAAQAKPAERPVEPKKRPKK
jgi:hypothetical protein